jgi:tetratricopeptide (TPR) repeat protein
MSFPALRPALFIVTLAIALAACRSAGDPVRRDDPWGNLKANRQFELAEEYYTVGRYENAIVEYRTYLDLYGLNHRANDAAFRIAQSLEALGERIEAASVYRSTGSSIPRPNWRRRPICAPVNFSNSKGGCATRSSTTSGRRVIPKRSQERRRRCGSSRCRNALRSLRPNGRRRGGRTGRSRRRLRTRFCTTPFRP